jgi:hypothetical protein
LNATAQAQQLINIIQNNTGCFKKFFTEKGHPTHAVQSKVDNWPEVFLQPGAADAQATPN